MNFSGFYGNEGGKELLSSLFDSGRFPHALVIQGPKGCGKRTLAEWIAKALLCNHSVEQKRPCGVCEACRKMENLGHPDVFCVAGGESARSIHIDVIRQIREDVNILPHEGRRKVYLLENASSMTEQAQNALLKIMEEPPGYACFLLTCESASQMLPTVLSRAVVISVGEVERVDAIRRVKELCPEASEEEIDAVWNLCGGNIGTMAEALRKDGMLVKCAMMARTMAEALLSTKEYELVEKSAPLLKDKELCRGTLLQLMFMVRDGLMIRSGFEKKQVSPIVLELSRRLTQEQLNQLMGCVREGMDGLERYVNHPLLVTKLCADMRAILV